MGDGVILDSVNYGLDRKGSDPTQEHTAED